VSQALIASPFVDPYGSSVINLGHALLSVCFTAADFGSSILIVRHERQRTPSPGKRGGSKSGALSQRETDGALSGLDLKIRVGRSAGQPGNAARKDGGCEEDWGERTAGSGL
jgi:hypothetical protein